MAGGLQIGDDGITVGTDGVVVTDDDDAGCCCETAPPTPPCDITDIVSITVVISGHTGCFCPDGLNDDDPSFNGSYSFVNQNPGFFLNNNKSFVSYPNSLCTGGTTILTGMTVIWENRGGGNRGWRVDGAKAGQTWIAPISIACISSIVAPCAPSSGPCTSTFRGYGGSATLVFHY